MIVNPLPQMQGGSFTPGYGGGGMRQVGIAPPPNNAVAQPNAMMPPPTGGMMPPQGGPPQGMPPGGPPQGGMPHMGQQAGPGIDFSKLQGGTQINHPQMGMQGAPTNQTPMFQAGLQGGPNGSLARQQVMAQMLRR